MWTQQKLKRKNCNFQSAVRCNNPECTLFVYFENFAAALTNLMELLLWALIHFLDHRNDSRTIHVTSGIGIEPNPALSHW